MGVGDWGPDLRVIPMGVDGSRSRLGMAGAAFASNWRNPNLRRAQLSFLGAWTAEWAFTVALGIVAYRDGGAAAVGARGPAAHGAVGHLRSLLSPIADRGRRERVLVPRVDRPRGRDRRRRGGRRGLGTPR